MQKNQKDYEAKIEFKCKKGETANGESRESFNRAASKTKKSSRMVRLKALRLCCNEKNEDHLQRMIAQAIETDEKKKHLRRRMGLSKLYSHGEEALQEIGRAHV